MNPFKAVIVALLLAAGVAVMIFGAQSHVQKQPEDPSFVVVDYWEKWTGNEGSQMQEIVDEFNQTVGKDKHIFVRYLSQSNITQKTLIATAAGVPPDIAGVWNDQLAQLGSQDALMPLDDLAREHNAAVLSKPYSVGDPTTRPIDEHTFKKVYWDACNYDGKLISLISTPAAIALHYNKRVLEENADALKAAGLDPNVPPKTIDELDRFAQALITRNGSGTIQCAGFLPLEPDWYVNDYLMYNGGSVWDEKTGKFHFDDPRILKVYEWIQSYSKRLGKDAMTSFRAGVGNFDSPQNAFLNPKTGVAMEIQGPWMSNYIEHLAPTMNRWHVSDDQSNREKAFPALTEGKTTLSEVRQTMNLPDATPTDGKLEVDAGIKKIVLTFDGKNVLSAKEMNLLPAVDRQNLTEWAAAAFPVFDPTLTDVSYCPFDALVIPRGAKHPKEAFEFMAYLTRQDVHEKLNMLHCKNSALATVSDNFIKNHPNPYIAVFERLASSPNARGLPRCPVWPEVSDALTSLAQGVALMEIEPKAGLADLQVRMQAKYDQYMERQRKRHLEKSP